MKKIVIIGGGIVGLAIAKELINRGQKKVVIIEKEKNIALHQSSRNSGVMHSGLYYKPGSLKAYLSGKGIKRLKAYCDSHNITWKECGKIVVATDKNQLSVLNKLLDIGHRNELKGIKKLDSKEINNHEPYVKGLAGISVPEESVVDYRLVAQSYLKEILSQKGEIKYNSKVEAYIEGKDNRKFLKLNTGEDIEADIIVATAGVYSDKIANILGIDIENQQILPFRGEYYLFKSEYEYLVKALVYPVPNPHLPFLGVHLTKMIDGKVEAGPNAVLALAREGYNWQTINIKELYESLNYLGLYKFIKKYPNTTFQEILRSLSKTLFINSLKKLIPDVRNNMFIRGNAGIRAQLINQEGSLIQDFDIRVKDNIISILNAPSPAATSSLAIAEHVVDYINL